MTVSEGGDVARSSSRRWLGVGAAFALVAVSAAICAPGLLGAWVYDDRTMVANPLYDDLGDAVRVFTYNSADYIGRGDTNREVVATYRPITMLTLVGTHAISPTPLAHHVVGWLLHLLSALLLYLGIKRQGEGADPIAAWLAALFLLHPIGVEAYVWINGRSDLVAGLFLACLVLLRPGRSPASIATVALWLLLGFMGTAAKLPFAIAAGFLWLGAWLRQEREQRKHRQIAEVLALVCGIGAVFGVRALYTSFGDSTTIGSGADIWALLGLAPKLASAGAHALLSLRAAAMQSMSWNAIQPWGAAEVIGATALLASVGGLVWRRDWGGLAYVAGAVAAIAPTVFVARSIWFGFDRYLYMPLILLIVAVEPYARELVARLGAHTLVVRLAAAAILLVAVSSTHLASRAYASHIDFLGSMIAERPDDPTVRLYITGTLWLRGDKAKAAEQLEEIPEPPWPQAMVVSLARISRDLGNSAMLEKAISYGRAAYPDDPAVAFQVMHWDYQNERYDDLLASVKRFPVDDPKCATIQREVRGWSETRVGHERRLLAEAADALRCSSP